MNVSVICNALDAWAPPALAASYDNVGLLVGRPDMPVTGALINLDVTEAVVAEAVARGCNLIITHHPIWFNARKRLNGDDYVSRAIMAAIRADVALYACHTNLDHVPHGVNRMIGERLALEGLTILQPSGPDSPNGAGMIGELSLPLDKENFLVKVKDAFHCGIVRYADAPLTRIHRVAVCGGAGSFLVADAIRAGADAFITADVTYHKFFDNEGKILLLDIGHYESEQFTSDLIFSYLSDKFPNFALLLSETHTNPVKYF